MFRNFFTPEQVDISPDYLIDMAADQWISTSLLFLFTVKHPTTPEQQKTHVLGPF